MKEKVKLTANILFSGIGCQERGFQDSGLFDIEVLNTSDINKESVLSYAAIHCGMTNEMVEAYTDYPSREEMAQYLTDINLGYEPEKNKYFDWFKLIKKKNKDLEKYWLACKLTHNLGDIIKIEELPYADFWTVSFCCQDISVAGKMKGLKPDSGTRSSLLWDNIKLLSKAKKNDKLPKYIMFENVKNLVSKKFIGDFNDLIEILDELGFNSYWQVINGKDCGIPQSRERVFVISIRKDIDLRKYTFPIPFDTGIRLKDILEEIVDEKYYLSNEKVQEFLKTIDTDKFCGNKNELEQVGYINNYNGDANRIYSDNIARTLKSEAGGGAKTGWYLLNKPITGLISNQGTKFDKETEYANTLLARDYKGFGNQAMNAVIEIDNSTIVQRPHGFNKGGEFIDCPSITSHSWEQNNFIKEEIDEFLIRIRKLTPRECFRLQGLTFEDCDKAAELGVADTHLYKQAGNGIITNCCALLAEHLYKAQYDNTYICTDERYQENFTNPQVE